MKIKMQDCLKLSFWSTGLLFVNLGNCAKKLRGDKLYMAPNIGGPWHEHIFHKYTYYKKPVKGHGTESFLILLWF